MDRPDPRADVEHRQAIDATDRQTLDEPPGRPIRAAPTVRREISTRLALPELVPDRTSAA